MNIHNNIRLILECKDSIDSITLDIPLLIRILELAREDVKDDMELHRITERLLKIRHNGMLTMDDYKFIANMKEEFSHELQEFKKQPDVAEDKSSSVKGSRKSKGYKESQDSLNPYDQYSAMAPARTEEVKEEKSDDVGEMIKDKLRIIIHNAEKMHDELKDTDDLPEWVKSKITLAQDYVSTAYDYTCGTHELGEAANAAQQAAIAINMKKKGIKPKNEEVHENDDAPFDKPYRKTSGTTTDKSGAKHTPMSKARHLAQQVMKKNAEKSVKEEVEQIDELSPATKASYVAKAKDQIKQSRPFTKKSDEYRDIAKNFIAKREKGIAKANEEVHELDEAGHLDRYIKSLGWDPKLLDMSRKQKYAQSTQYASWRQRQGSVRTESMSAHEKFKAGVKKAGYDMDAGAKRLEDLLAKQKKEREENEKAEKPEMKQETMMGKLANSYEPEGDSLVESKHRSKAAMMVKGIFNLHKKRKMNEETYDHEKDDKQEKTLGKKPKLETNDEKDEFGKEKASARAVLSGGKTETGAPRDTIEIDPMMRNRPGQGDISKKEGRLGIKGQEK